MQYLGLHLDRRLTWKYHVKAKKEQINIKLRSLYWLLGQKSVLSLENKLLIYKTIIKPIWTYAIQIWGTASNSNIEITQRVQSKTLRSITKAPWYVSNHTIQRDLKICTVKDEIKKFSDRYKTRLENHPNPLAVALLQAPATTRLKRKNILNL